MKKMKHVVGGRLMVIEQVSVINVAVLPDHFRELFDTFLFQFLNPYKFPIGNNRLRLRLRPL